MGATAWFEVEWSDAALDKQRADAKRAGQAPPPRQSLVFLPSSPAFCLAHPFPTLSLCLRALS